MKLFWKKFFICLLVLFVSAALIGFSIVVNIGLVGLPENLSYLIVFISVALITFYSLSRTENIVPASVILSIIIIAWFFLFLPKAINSSLSFTLVTIPFFISFLLALGSGYIYYRRRSLKFSILMAIVPLILTLGLASVWNNKIVYGSVDGKVQSTSTPNFSVLGKSGRVVNNETMKGKIVLMDFWFISCPPCWVKFPELQRVYDQYKSNDRIAIYAVNRPMKNDQPNQLYTSIENRDYTFPVAKGTEELMTAFGIDYYPTIIILDANGDIVFKGAMEKAEAMIESLLGKEG